MRCAYCGAEADQSKSYCLDCGAKLVPERKVVTRNISIERKRNVPQETIEQPAASDVEYPKTKAALDEIFGPEQDWTPPAVESAPQQKKEVWDFPVTPCADSMPEKTAAEDYPSPVYSTAPLREDVLPVAPVVETVEVEKEEEPDCESRLKLPKNRSLLKMILLGLITAGIYPTVIWSRMVTELNIVASRNDGKRTMPYFAMMILTPITLSIFTFVWMHKFCHRIGDQLEFQKCDYRFGAKDFWLWLVLGSLFVVGPCVFVHKLVKSMNLINSHYNTYGW